MTKKANYKYSQVSCQLFCYQLHLTRTCNCSDYGSFYYKVGVSDFNYCFNDQWTCCDRFYYETFNAGDFIQTHCNDKCPRECTFHRFDHYQTFYEYPDETYVERVLLTNEKLVSRYGNHTDFTVNLASNVVKFSIFYETLTYTEVKEEPMIRWSGLLGSIGGYLHLFLGMSLISFAEVFELFAKFMVFCFAKD